MIVLVALLEFVALLVLMARLSSGRNRRPAAAPMLKVNPQNKGVVSVILPTFNEASRVALCLEGLAKQGASVREIIVVDSGSTDGTRELVESAKAKDPRFRLERDAPLPPGWVGKVWALQHGLSVAGGSWVLGVDADTVPKEGMVDAVLSEATEAGFDVVSFSPRFAGMSLLEQWLQPSMLLTLVYRSGAAGGPRQSAESMLANGQCFLARREVLERHGGYELARSSWADDVALARELARRGAVVGFLDGSRLYDVRAYASAGQMWKEWGRSFDLADASNRWRHWLDVAFLFLVQVLPWAVIVLFFTGLLSEDGIWRSILLGVAGMILAIRVLMLLALAPSYEKRTAGFWLSPLSDALAWVRLVASTLVRPRAWRGREFRHEA